MEEHMQFCPNCGQVAVRWMPQIASMPQAYRKPKQKMSRRARMISIISVLLVICIVAGWFIIPTVIGTHRIEQLAADAGGYDELVNLEPAALPVSGQPAFTVSPMAGITVSGAENALDKNRRFTAKPMSEDELFQHSEESGTDEYVHLAGFLLDAGMEPGERFDLPVTITIDLETMEIPAYIYESTPLVLSHIREDGIEEQVSCRVDNGVLTAAIDSNSWFIIKGVAVGIITIREYLKARQFFFNGDAAFRFMDVADTYKLYWPATMEPANKREVEAQEARLTAYYESFGIDMSQGFERGLNALCVKETGGHNSGNYKKTMLELIFNHPEYKECRRIMNDPTWVRENLLPAKIQVIIEDLELVSEYLFEENRGFRKPTHIIQVGVAGDGGLEWPHGDNSLGVAVNEYGLKPYLHLNAGKLTLDAVGAWGHVEERISSDNMLLTVLHEVFHIVQCGYISNDSKDRRWFWEATAVVLEKEGYEYFTGTGWITSTEEEISLTDRNHYAAYYSSYANQKYWLSGETGFTNYDMHYGYAAADFLEYICDNCYRAGFRINFLPALLMQYSYSSDTSGYSAILKMLGGVPANLSKAYRDFMEQINPAVYTAMYKRTVKGEGEYAALFRDKTYKLTADNPLIKITTQYFPLTLTPRRLSLALPSGTQAKLIVQMDSDAIQKSEYFKLYACFDQAGQQKKPVLNEGYTDLGEVTGLTDVLLYEQCSNSALPKINYFWSGGSYSALLLIQPPEPVIEFNNAKITMTVPAESGAVKTKHVTQYQFTVLEPDGTAHTYIVPAEKPKLVIPYAEVGFDNAKPDEYFKFYYTEMIPLDKNRTAFISGPDGVAAEYGIKMPTDVFAGAAEWSTFTDDGDEYTYYADLIDPFYVYIKAYDEDTLQIAAGSSKSDAMTRAQDCVFDEEFQLYKFYGWVDGRYACYEFTFGTDIYGNKIVEGYIAFYEKEEHVNSIFSPLEAYKIIAREAAE